MRFRRSAWTVGMLVLPCGRTASSGFWLVLAGIIATAGGCGLAHFGTADTRRAAGFAARCIAISLPPDRGCSIAGALLFRTDAQHSHNQLTRRSLPAQ